MLMFALLSTLLILSGIRTAGDDLDWDSPRPLALAVITKNIHGHVSYIEPIFHGSFVQLLQRRLLEHPHKAKQVYRSHDYNVARRHRQLRSKLDEGRSYRSSIVKNALGDEDEDEEEEEEEEEEENQGEEEDKFDDEGADEEAAEQNEEETIAVAAAVRNRVARSGYVPLGDKATGEREGQEVIRIRSATEECEEPTELAQYYEYEIEVRNVASQDARCGLRLVLPARIFGGSLLILLLA